MVLIMVVAIVQVANNTSRTANYYNTESEYQAPPISPKTDYYENNNWVPSSDFKDDWVPYKGSGYIEVWLDDGPKVQISDDNYQFYMVGPTPGTSERSESWHAFDRGVGRFILRLDEVQGSNGEKDCGFTFLKYEDDDNVTVGYIAYGVLQAAAVVVPIVLMAIFL